MHSYPDRERVDAHEKVRGAARYAADVPLPGMLHAMTVPATITRGRVLEVVTEDAAKVPGVVRILTSADFAGIEAPTSTANGGFAVQSIQPMVGERIAFRGQPIALVVAETLEGAIEAAHAVRARYDAEPFTAGVHEPGADRELLEANDLSFGAPGPLLNAAHATVSAEYTSPRQFHNPMELIATVASWVDDQLTVHEGTQNAGAIRSGLAAALGLDPSAVHVKSPTVGGSFGQKSALQGQTMLVARAAMLTGRPIKLVVPRAQLFAMATFRPTSTHRVQLGADAAGRMLAARYDTQAQTSRADDFLANYHEVPTVLYGIENYAGTGAVVRTDTQAPGIMRSPQEHPASFAFESAVDELAYAVGADPLEFRLANDATRDPHTNKPFSSRHLAKCLRRGAQRFGWDRRSPQPGSMAAADGAQVGWGVAVGAYKASQTAAIATLRVRADGTTTFSTTGHEMGQGIRNALTAALLAELQIRPHGLQIHIGDTDAAPQHLTAGSWGTVSSVPIALEAASRLTAAVDTLLAGRRPDGDLHAALAHLGRDELEVEVSQLAPGMPPEALDALRAGGRAVAGPVYPDFASFSYIAHFVEVHVEASIRRIRVPRVVSVADCGRVVSPRTAASQVRGGVVWGLSAALREEATVDPRYGGVLNDNIADYVVAVNADIGDIDVSFIDEPDRVLNPAGVKSLGEVAMVGVSAAIANAVYHATGTRVRSLPIHVDDLL